MAVLLAYGLDLELCVTGSVAKCPTVILAALHLEDADLLILTV
jgi:hypothetical protein